MADIKRSFWYPDQPDRPAHRMCADGQRRAADYSLRIYEELTSGETSPEVTNLLKKAARAERRLAGGKPVDKRDLIALQALGVYVDGQLDEYVSPEGDFLLQAYDGSTHRRNVHEERQKGKIFY